MNQFATMLEMQKALQKRLGTDFNSFGYDGEATAFIKEHSIHLNQEINEMLYELPFFKPWKDYSNMSLEDRVKAFTKAKMECVDAWHFFMNIILALGFTSDEFYDMYMAKNKENFRRQDAGYTSDVSYKDQSVEEVMNNAKESVDAWQATNTPLSKVMMDGINGEALTASDFITIHNDTEGNQQIMYHTDALSMGLAIKRLAVEYNKMLKECSMEELRHIESALGPLDFCKELLPNE